MNTELAQEIWMCISDILFLAAAFGIGILGTGLFIGSFNGTSKATATKWVKAYFRLLSKIFRGALRRLIEFAIWLLTEIKKRI